MTRPSTTLRLRLDRAALAANWRALDQRSGSAVAGAAVKADGYGLGVEHVVPILREAGCRTFYVAHWSEVEPVLRHAPAREVVVLHGPLTANDVAFARETGVRPVINSLPQAKVWLDGGGGVCDLMLDTGINRLGLDAKDIGNEMIRRLQVDTLMSHLASADEDSLQNEEQRWRFAELAQHIRHNARSMANSAGIALGTRYHFDKTRPGLALYGGVPRPELSGDIAQVAFPQAMVIQTRELSPGDRVGYNGTWQASQATPVATVSLGYADGLMRCWGNRGALEHGGKPLPFLGRISMDMIVVDRTATPQVREGDWLDLPFALPLAAGTSGLSQYELLTSIGSRYAIYEET